MSEDFGSDYLTIMDEDGGTFELEVLGDFELDGQAYMAALPADMEETDPDYGIILLKVMEEDGEEVYDSIDDDAELQRVYDHFMQIIEEDDGSEA